MRRVARLALGGIALLRGVSALLRRIVAALGGRLLAVAHRRLLAVVVAALGRRGAVGGGRALGRVGRSAVGGGRLLGSAAVLGGFVVLAGHDG